MSTINGFQRRERHGRLWHCALRQSRSDRLPTPRRFRSRHLVHRILQRFHGSLGLGIVFLGPPRPEKPIQT
ncbi:MAG TPA: hypothetical protein VFL57_16520, partial [Bryobacteraceae bacterium]|nr:hypothetical protein [Bryobacteraceae bacterium]